MKTGAQNKFHVERLFTCPACRRGGFTEHGLRQHRCYGTGGKGHGTKPVRLTTEQLRKALDEQPA